MALLPVAEAHARLLALFAPLAPEEVPLTAAAGRVLARDVIAARAPPPGRCHQRHECGCP